MGSSCACGFNIIFKSLFIIIIIIIIIFQLVNSIHFSASQMHRYTLCAQILLQFYSDLFESLQIFFSGAEDMHVVLTYSSNHYLLLLLLLLLLLFNLWTQSFFCISIAMLYFMCAPPLTFLIHFFESLQIFIHALKMCMWFKHYRQTIFIYFLSYFSGCELRHFSASQMHRCTLCAQLILQFYSDLFESCRYLFMGWRCASGFKY